MDSFCYLLDGEQGESFPTARAGLYAGIWGAQREESRELKNEAWANDTDRKSVV